jgi:hypothetical protein
LKIVEICVPVFLRPGIELQALMNGIMAVVI